MAKKRVFDDAFNPAKVTSEAARFNETVLRELQLAYAADAEVDLSSMLPSDYQMRLAERKFQAVEDLGFTRSRSESEIKWPCNPPLR